MAQPYRFRHLTTAEGLLSDLKLVMTEDQQGRLWIGSDEGINVFDGYQLSTFNQPDSIFRSSNNILQIYCDKKGTIWVATPLGVFFKEDHDNRFHRLPYEEELNYDYIFFGETTDGDVLIANKHNCYVASPGGLSKKLSGFDSLFTQNKSLVSFQIFKGDEWLMAFRNKMFLVNMKTQKVIRELNVYNAWCAARVSDTTLLAGSFAHDTISLVNINTGKSERINTWPTSDRQPISGYAASIVPLGNLKFAVACRYFGVYILDVGKRNAIAIQHDPSDPASLKWNACRRLMVTRNGTLFAHTRGLSFTQLSKPLFPSQKYLADKNGDRYNAGFTTVLQDGKKNYWVGTNKHLALWNRETNVSKYYPYYDAFSGGQKFRTVRTVVTDRLDRVWVGTFGGGIGRLLPDGSFEQFRRNPSDELHSLPSNDIHAITKDTSENFIICANGGFALFDPVAGKTKRFTDHPQLGKISDQTTFYVLADKRNNWWIAQGNGLFYYDPKIELLTQIYLPGAQQNIQTNVVGTDSSGNVYAGGLDGLYIISPITLKVQKVLTKRDGLTSNNIVGLLCDKMGMLWILGNIGVSRFDPRNGKFESFDVRDGIEQSNHTLCNFFMANDGEIFFTSAEGFNYFYPENIKAVRRPLKVMLTSLEFTDSTITLPGEKGYHLHHNQNNVSFSFLAVDFQFGPSIQYRYQLAGFDKGYIYAGKQRTSRYTNLPPGNYSFMVEASLNGYDWFKLDNSISLHVAKAFWKTWWFNALSIAIVAGVLFLIFSSRISKVKREETLKRDFENQLAQVRMNLLRTQMNPHFLFNCLNSINSFILKNDRQNASGYLTKFSRLMRLILDNSRNEWVTLESELKAIELYVQLESLRFNHAFTYAIHISEEMDAGNIILPPMLIQPYVENAIWHGLMYRKEPGGMLTVDIKEMNDLIEVVIIDNGVGRAASEALKSKSALQQKSYGMKITSERMRVVNVAYQINAHAAINDRVDADGQVAGTEVVLTLKKIVQEQN
jgi:hypothetical protein